MCDKKRPTFFEILTQPDPLLMALAAQAALAEAAALEAQIKAGCSICGAAVVAIVNEKPVIVPGAVLIQFRWPSGAQDAICAACAKERYNITAPPPVDMGALITVCDKCSQASCWQGLFYCNDYRTAGIVQRTRRELAALGREHPSYWKTDEELANTPGTRFCVAEDVKAREWASGELREYKEGVPCSIALKPGACAGEGNSATLPKSDWLPERPDQAPLLAKGSSAHGELLYEAHRAMMPANVMEPVRPPYAELAFMAQTFWAAVAEKYHAGLREHGVT